MGGDGAFAALSAGAPECLQATLADGGPAVRVRPGEGHWQGTAGWGCQLDSLTSRGCGAGSTAAWVLCSGPGRRGRVLGGPSAGRELAPCPSWGSRGGPGPACLAVDPASGCSGHPGGVRQTGNGQRSGRLGRTTVFGRPGQTAELRTDAQCTAGSWCPRLAVETVLSW